MVVKRAALPPAFLRVGLRDVPRAVDGRSDLEQAGGSPRVPLAIRISRTLDVLEPRRRSCMWFSPADGT